MLELELADFEFDFNSRYLVAAVDGLAVYTLSGTIVAQVTA